MQPCSLVLQVEAVCLVLAMCRAARHRHRHRRRRQPDPKWLAALCERLRQMARH